jgi:hypothetical protein
VTTTEGPGAAGDTADVAAAAPAVAVASRVRDAGNETGVGTLFNEVIVILEPVLPIDLLG